LYDRCINSTLSGGILLPSASHGPGLAAKAGSAAGVVADAIAIFIDKVEAVTSTGAPDGASSGPVDGAGVVVNAIAVLVNKALSLAGTSGRPVLAQSSGHVGSHRGQDCVSLLLSQLAVVHLCRQLLGAGAMNASTIVSRATLFSAATSAMVLPDCSSLIRSVRVSPNCSAATATSEFSGPPRPRPSPNWGASALPDLFEEIEDLID
jgi:hypothetical protein